MVVAMEMLPLSELPVLYSFRRCPYAMRARMAVWASGQQVGLREVVLRDKPAELLAASPKGTVPVLVLGDGTVIDESLDIMRWALGQADPESWLPSVPLRGEMEQWVADCDGGFKHHLDRYKYASRYEGADSEAHRALAAEFLGRLDAKLGDQEWLFGNALCHADVAIAPFIRQFANTDRAWFDGTPYVRLQAWLERFLALPVFRGVMDKYPPWRGGDAGVRFSAGGR